METIIHLHDGLALLYPFIPEPVKKALTYWHKSLEWDSEKGKRVVSGEYRQLFQKVPAPLVPAGNGQPYGETISIPYGLVSLVTSKLSSLGIKHRFVDSRTALPQPSLYDEAVEMLRPYQAEGFMSVLFNYGGIMQCPTGWGKTHIMAAIIKSFRHSDLQDRHTPLTVVAAPDKEVVAQTYEAFKELLKDREVGCCMSGSHKDSDDIVVATMDSLQNLDPLEVGLLLVDEVHEAATATRAPKIMAMTKAIKWGFSATPYGRFDGADIATDALVGPTVYSRTYAQGIADGALVPIKVYWVKVPAPDLGVDTVHSYQKHDSVVRYGLVKNKGMLKQIAALLDRIPDSMQTLCITQLLEHVKEIHDVALDVVYVHGTNDAAKMKKSRHGSIDAISKVDRGKIYNRFKSGDITKVISTTIYQQGVNFPNLSVMINAGGGGSAIAAGQIPGRTSRSIAGKDCSYIIDFWHDWDMVVNSSGRRRPGIIHSADCERSEVYGSSELGFEQVWVDSVEDIPFLRRDNEQKETGKPCEAVQEKPAKRKGKVLCDVPVRGGDTAGVPGTVEPVRQEEVSS